VQARPCVAGHAGGRARRPGPGAPQSATSSWTAGEWQRALVSVQESAMQPNTWMKPTRSLVLSLVLGLHMGFAALPAEARGGL